MPATPNGSAARTDSHRARERADDRAGALRGGSGDGGGDCRSDWPPRVADGVQAALVPVADEHPDVVSVTCTGCADAVLDNQSISVTFRVSTKRTP